MSSVPDTVSATVAAPAITAGDARPRRSQLIPGPPSVYDAIDAIQDLLDTHGSSAAPRRVLEAGCGSTGYLTMRPQDHLTGIDISESQLQRNQVLHEKILGDLQTYPLPREHFDVVVCWYVLEHLPDPDLALKNMIASMKPGGLLVIAVPSVTSFKGLLTKFTPHWFHVAVHRHVFRRKDAGREGYPPFPTYLRWSIRLEAFRQLASENGLAVEGAWTFEDYTQRRLRTKSQFYRMLFRLARVASGAVSLNRWNVYITDFAVALRRTDEGETAV